MYALSTVIFVTVLALLLISNFSPENQSGIPADKVQETMKKRRRNNNIRKVCLVFAAFAIVASVSFTAYKKYSASHSDELYVYNWGEYIDPEVIELFEEETGIHVTYDMFETNEEMYPVIEAGAACYDVVCPSDYMIQKMAENGLLAEINFDNIPNISNIDPLFLEKSRSFDPQNRYSVPYTWGTVGILYNTKRIEELGAPAPTKWSDLWNPVYKGEILMQDSVRDAFMVALKSLGYSMNTENAEELKEARDLLIAQKPLVQAYVIDQVRDKMIGGEAAVGVIYSGEMLYIQDEVANLGLDYTLEYVIPEEGTNLWFDSWVIPANARNKENAEKWIDFLCRPDIAKMNFEYITYSTPNNAAKELLEEDIQTNKAIFPDMDELEGSEVFQYLGDEADSIYNDMWKEVKSN